MFDLGLSNDDTRTYLRHLATSHSVTIRAQILDLDHHFISDISDVILDGQVTIDWEGENATRALTLLAFDPEYDLGLDTSEYADGVWFFDRMIQVTTEVFVPELNRVVACPVFTGPVRKFTRFRDVVTIDCVGKDVFARQSWPRIVLKKDTNYVTALKKLLRELGETKFKFEATTKSRLADDKVIDRSMSLSPWGWCRSVTASLGLRLHYDGAGYAVLRQRSPDTPAYVFNDGTHPRGTMLDVPEIEGDYSRIANVVRAEGPRGRKNNPHFEVTVDDDSVIHPTNLRRGGKPLYFGAVVIRDSITSKADARRAAKAELRDRQNAAYRVSFDSLPVFPLEVGDFVKVAASGYTAKATLTKFSFGFLPDAVMPVGYDKLVAPNIARIRGV